MNLKEKLQSGQKIYGSMIRIIRNPAVCLFAKNAGLDFIMFDCEHGNFNMETLHDNFIQASSIGLGGFLRATELSKSWISRPLDSGATGVMVPMTETPEQAREIVRWSKYAPIGGRGYGSGIASTAYATGIKSPDATEAANNSILSIAQIETRLAVDNADLIAAVEGIDVLLIGPNDLSISLGIPGDMMNPLELDAIAHVANACKKNGKAFGIHAGPKMLQKFIDDLTFIMMQGDADILREGFVTIRKNCENLEEK